MPKAIRLIKNQYSFEASDILIFLKVTLGDFFQDPDNSAGTAQFWSVCYLVPVS